MKRLSESQSQALAALDTAGALSPDTAILATDTRLTVFGGNLWNRAVNGGLVQRDGRRIWITAAGQAHVVRLRQERAREEARS